MLHLGLCRQASAAAHPSSPACQLCWPRPHLKQLQLPHQTHASTMRVPLFQVDALAARPFAGNPAAVCLLQAPISDALRAAVAAEMNLSETAFIEPMQAAAAPDAFKTQDTFRLRWFTPAQEVPLCGHATMASAAALFYECNNASPVLRFHTLSGVLSVSRSQQAGRSMLAMSLPASPATDPLPPTLQPPASDGADGGNSVAALLRGNKALGELLYALLHGLPGAAAPHAALGEQFHIADWLGGVVSHVGFVAALKYLLVVLRPGVGAAGLRGLSPNQRGMELAVSAAHMTGVIVTAAAEPGDGGGHDFYSRFFAPWAGIPEDPVTGSAHAVLGPYWAARLGGKQQLAAQQCSQRCGELWLDLAAEPGRVVVSGQAVVVLRGELELPDEEDD